MGLSGIIYPGILTKGNKMQLNKQQKEDLKTLEGRDLMYFLLDMYENSYVDGDSITNFLDENLSDSLVKSYIEEETE